MGAHHSKGQEERRTEEAEEGKGETKEHAEEIIETQMKKQKEKFGS